MPDWREPEEPDWISCVVSLRDADGTWKLHASDRDIDAVALAGPRLATAMTAADLPNTYDYAARSTAFPMGGLHVDASEQRVDVWLGFPVPRFGERLQHTRRAWDVRYHHDHFEAVSALLGARLVLHIRSPDDLVAHVRRLVLRAPHDRSELVREVDAELALKGGSLGEVVIDPRALRDDPAPRPGDDAARAFDEAVARWRSRSG